MMMDSEIKDFNESEKFYTLDMEKCLTWVTCHTEGRWTDVAGLIPLYGAVVV